MGGKCHFGRELADNVPACRELISLQKCCFYIYMQQIPRPISGSLHLHAKAWSGTGWTIGLQLPDLVVLKTPEDPPGLALLEIAFLVSFDG